MKTKIIKANYIDIFAKTRESTASSPSGLYYGYYITACESETPIDVNLIFMTIPFHVDKPLSRWTNSLHCIIQKRQNHTSTD